MSVSEGHYLAAALCFGLFIVLGVVIFGRPHVLFDIHAQKLRARATRLARLLTFSGRTRALAAGYIIAVIVFSIGHLHLRVPVILALSQIVSQSIVEGFKVIYRRTRPDYWLHRLDPGHSYPSGHATTAVVSYAGWAIVVAHSALPDGLKWTLVAALCLWAVGIDWSRLALGAHYFSDVLGGTLFGAAWMFALVGAVGRIIFVP